jgi:uncharacterized secreted protein with C-terminal beta-propeller domain
MRMRAIAVTAIAGLLAAIALVTTSAPAAAAPRKVVRPALKAFESCGSLVRYGRRHAFRTLGPEVIGPIKPIAPLALLPQPGVLMREDAAGAPGTSAPIEGQDFSATNVQEAGIDEPDIVKTDGSRLFAVARGTLHAVDVTGDTPQRTDTLELPPKAHGHQLLLRGSRLLVMSRTVGSTVLSEVEISPTATMRVVRTLTVRGDFIDARMTGGAVRVVISTSPLALNLPLASGKTLWSMRQAALRNRARVRRSGALRWVPSYVVRDRRTRTKVRRFVPCRAVRRSNVFAGLNTLTVLTIDLDTGLPPLDSDSVMTDGEDYTGAVYAGRDGLYVATERWSDDGEAMFRVGSGTTTQIHKFDASQPGDTSYRGSGSVRGYLLSQFAMSEYQGHVRVASTSDAVEFAGGRDRKSESFVTVLGEQAGTLVRVGGVRGLGRGERIYSVRFIDDKGYVVTFREVDPLYTLDLSTPSAPRVVGELKIRGFSAYLHPAGDDLLIGVGQDATRQGRTLGTQISLFDVSDPANPQRLHQRTVASGSWSEVEYNHHAFLFWPPLKLAVLPVDARDAKHRSLFSGAVGFRIGRTEGIAESFRISHGSRRRPQPVTRSLVVGGSLLTLSEAGLAANSLSTFRGLGFVPFPR